MKQVVAFLKAVADETRLRILKLLMDGEFCVCELMDALEVNQSNLSRHLSVLKNAGLVTDRKDGLWVYYTVTKEAKPVVKMLLTRLGNLDTERTQRDHQRLQQRLAMRTNGKCLLGAGRLPPSPKFRRR
ncbi:MAG: metalloregulator ArsR/SmtB family transcription factor [Armatimonadetes bacterium]|nr:metalloregulator ArsR/SmtB family transcription factor [Armatimonadota bacterium]MDW8122005.1 metalloregulator ArsR/SmtB family transcription factor [Armatimonadota bacterium]